MEADTVGRITANVYVLPDFAGGWFVSRASGELTHHKTQAQAMKVGRRLARRYRVELVTLGVDGQIRSKDSYGNESPMRDTEH